MFPELHLGPAVLPAAPVLLLAGFLLGSFLAERFLRRRGEKPEAVTNLVLIAGGAGLLTARLFFVVLHPALFKQAPLDVFSRDPGLLDPWGAFFGAALAGLIYGSRKGLTFWDTLDRLTPLLSLLAVFLGLAHLASGQAYGAPSRLPWAIRLWGADRHPSQAYESLGALLILVLLWRQFGAAGRAGRLFLQFAALTAGMFVFLSAFRGDSTLIPGALRLEQLLALACLGLALILLEIRAVRVAGPTGKPS
jgi:phosphatidylglycerol---prolipoprotein diacylglyceryl transferase